MPMPEFLWLDVVFFTNVGEVVGYEGDGFLLSAHVFVGVGWAVLGDLFIFLLFFAVVRSGGGGG